MRQRWRELVAKEARGEPLSLAERNELLAFEERHHESVADERPLWEQLGAFGHEPLPGECSDADLVAGALAKLPEQLLSGPSMLGEDEVNGGAPERKPIAIWWVASTVAVLVLGLGSTLTWWALAAKPEPGEPSRSPIASSTPMAVPLPADPIAPVEPDPVIIVDAEPEVAIAEDEALAPGCTRLRARTQVCLDGKAHVSSHNPLRIRLDAGRVEVRSSAPITVEAPSGPVVTEAAEFRVAVGDVPTTTSLVVIAGAVSFWRDDQLQEVHAGETIELHKRARKPRRKRRREPRLSGEELLATARALVQRGEIERAIARYQELLDRAPESVEAHTARVTLGRLELQRGHPERALAHFGVYLRGPARALREEALYGRIRALRALQRDREEAGAIAEFLAIHPDSIYADRLQQRRRVLEP